MLIALATFVLFSEITYYLVFLPLSTFDVLGFNATALLVQRQFPGLAGLHDFVLNALWYVFHGLC